MSDTDSVKTRVIHPMAHPVSRHVRNPDKTNGVALCLSGGGFRAALFHLGVVRCFNELQILPRIDTISAVSGGSIFAAFLARVLVERANTWPVPAEWSQVISQPFYNFVRKDSRTGPVISEFANPLKWGRRGTAVIALQKKYEENGLTNDLTLGDLPTRTGGRGVDFQFCSTAVDDADSFLFGAMRTQNGETETFAETLATHMLRSQLLTGKEKRIWSSRRYIADSHSLPLSMAVAASSCFPPVFGPMHAEGFLEILDAPNRSEQPHTLRLSDGGVRDNFGLEPVWSSKRYVIVSDGGAPFRFEKDLKFTSSDTMKILEVAQQQSTEVRKRWFIDMLQNEVLKGTYIGIASHASGYTHSMPTAVRNRMVTYGRQLAEDTISAIRTDINEFTDAECRVLENHGYALAYCASFKYLAGLGLDSSVEMNVPNREWWYTSVEVAPKTEERIRDALKYSDSSSPSMLKRLKRRVFGLFG